MKGAPGSEGMEDAEESVIVREDAQLVHLFTWQLFRKIVTGDKLGTVEVSISSSTRKDDINTNKIIVTSTTSNISPINIKIVGAVSACVL